MLRLYIFRVRFFQQFARQFACRCIILAKYGVVLVAVQLDKVEAFFVRRPADISEITVGRIACIQIDRLFGSRVVDAYFYLVAGHSRHWITDVVHFPYACGDVYKRILRDHAFVHAVESEQVSFRAPESAFVDAEFIAVYGLTADNAFGLVSDGLFVHIQVIVYCVGYVSVGCAIVLVSCFLLQFQCADNPVVLEIVYDELAGYFQ